MRKRSKYRPKGVRLDTVAYVVSGMHRVDQVEDAGIALKIKNHAALAAVVQGKAERDDIDVLIAALNMTEAFCIMGIGSDWRTEVRHALDCLHAMSVRGLTSGRFILTGLEMKAINLAMDIHDAQLETATVRQMEQAIDLVVKTIKHGKARRIEVAA
jgi:hypothetical protein